MGNPEALLKPKLELLISTVFILFIICLALYDLRWSHVKYLACQGEPAKEHILFNLSKWRKEHRIILITSMIMISSLALGSLFYVLFISKLIESMYRGESVEFLNRLLRN